MGYMTHHKGLYCYTDTQDRVFQHPDLTFMVRLLNDVGYTVKLDTMVDVITGESVLLYVVTENK